VAIAFPVPSVVLGIIPDLGMVPGVPGTVCGVVAGDAGVVSTVDFTRFLAFII